MRSTPLTAEAFWPATGAQAAFLGRTAWLGARAVFAAPAVLAGRCAFFVLIMVTLTAFWDTVTAERATALARALPAGGLSLYIGVTEWVTLALPSIHLRLEDDIRSGALDARLLRPKSHLAIRLAEGAGALLARMAALGAAGLLLLALTGRAPPPLAAWPALTLLAVLGGVIGLLTLALVGLCAFWMRRVLAAYLVNQKLSFLLGGLAAPVTLYPEWLERLSLASPFAAQLYGPAAYAVAPTSQAFAWALAAQAVWLALLGAAVAGLWAAGVARLTREGG